MFELANVSRFCLQTAQIITTAVPHENLYKQCALHQVTDIFVNDRPWKPTHAQRPRLLFIFENADIIRVFIERDRKNLSYFLINDIFAFSGFIFYTF